MKPSLGQDFLGLDCFARVATGKHIKQGNHHDDLAADDERVRIEVVAHLWVTFGRSCIQGVGLAKPGPTSEIYRLR